MKMISSDSTSEWQTPEEREITKQIQKGRIMVISWLGLSRKPSGQVIEHLKANGFSDIVIQSVMESLQEDGYLNDEAIAARTIRQRQGRRSESRRALNQRLQRMGLPDDVIESSLQHVSSDYEYDLNAACQLIESRFAKQLALIETNEARMALWNKTGRFLASRGFNQSTILQALRKLFPGIDSYEDHQA